MIDEKKALELIAQGEGQQVELKREVPSKVRELSEEICALANASGGCILLGVKNDGTFTEGFTINNSKRSALRDSVDQIEPQVDCDIYPLSVSGHEIWVMEVKEGEDKPYFCSGAVHIRRGANSQKLRKPADVRKILWASAPGSNGKTYPKKPSATSNSRPASDPTHLAKNSLPTSASSRTKVK